MAICARSASRMADSLAVDDSMVAIFARCQNLLITTEYNIFIDVDNQVINILWQECRALAFLLVYDVCALPTVSLYVEICWGYWYDHYPKVSPRYLQFDGYCYLDWELVSPGLEINTTDLVKSYQVRTSDNLIVGDATPNDFIPVNGLSK